MSKAVQTLIVPFGLKSLLVAVGEAVILEQPPNVTEFLASYCTQLLELKQGTVHILNAVGPLLCNQHEHIELCACK